MKRRRKARPLYPRTYTGNATLGRIVMRKAIVLAVSAALSLIAIHASAAEKKKLAFVVNAAPAKLPLDHPGALHRPVGNHKPPRRYNSENEPPDHTHPRRRHRA